MVDKILVKKRCFRLDSGNPYRTRNLTYHLVNKDGGLQILVAQKDYVLHSQVAETAIEPLAITNRDTGQQLIEHMLKNARSVTDAAEIYKGWQAGKVSLVQTRKNVLVSEAIRRRFARNLKKL